MAVEKMLKFVSVGKSMPEKRSAEERAHDFNEIYGEYAAAKDVPDDSNSRFASEVWTQCTLKTQVKPL